MSTSIILKGRKFLLNGGGSAPPVDPPVDVYGLFYPPDQSLSEIPTPVAIDYSQLGYLQKVEDTSFNVPGYKWYIKRLTNGTEWGKTSTQDIMNHYSKTPVMNCNNTLGIIDGKVLDFAGGAFNNGTGTVLKSIAGASVNYQWSSTVPDHFWHADGTSVYCKNARTDATVFSKSLNSAYGLSSVTKGKSEGCMDIANRYAPIYAMQDGVQVAGYYDIQNDVLKIKPQTFFSPSLDAGTVKDFITISPYGNYVIHRNSDTGGTDMQLAMYDMDLNFIKYLGQGSHEDVQVNQAGEEVLIQHINIGWKRLSDWTDIAGPTFCTVNQSRSFYNDDFNGGTPMGGHCSGRNVLRLGHSYNSNGTPNNRRLQFSLKLDNGENETALYNFFGFARLQDPLTPEDYLNETKGTCSLDGKYMFASTWWPGAPSRQTFMFWCEKVAV